MLAWKSYHLEKKDFKWSPGLYYVTQDCRHREMRNCNYWNVEKWPRQCQVHVLYHELFLLSLHFGPIIESQTLLGQTQRVEVLGSGCPKVVSLDLLGRVHTGLFTMTRFLFIHSCETVEKVYIFQRHLDSDIHYTDGAKLQVTKAYSWQWLLTISIYNENEDSTPQRSQLWGLSSGYRQHIIFKSTYFSIGSFLYQNYM